MSTNVYAQHPVARRDMLSAMISARSIERVDIKEITMAPGQRAPLHLHPCPVVGYVAEGTLIYQIKGQPAKTLMKGDAFYEPADTAIARFDNASSDQPLKFIAFYLNSGESELVQIITENTVNQADNEKHL